jgi:hypothetical protein
MRLLVLSFTLFSSIAFAQSPTVIYCASQSRAIDAHIAYSDSVIYNHQEGVREGNSMVYSDAIQIRNKIWQETLQERFDIRSVAYNEDGNLCARIAASAISKVDAILEEYGLQTHEVGG